MKLNRYRIYLLVEALVAIIVPILFKCLDKKIAAMIAGSLFLASTLTIFIFECKLKDFYKRATFWGSGLFLLASAFPIFGLRLIYWDLPFEQIQFFGISGPWLHQISNTIFMIMLVCIFVDTIRYAPTPKLRKYEE